MNLAMQSRSSRVVGRRFESARASASVWLSEAGGRALSVAALSVVMLGAAACGEDASNTGSSRGGAAGNAGSGGAAGGAATGGAAGNGGTGGDVDCERTGAEPADAVCVGYVRGSVVDERGSPLAAAPVSVCGPACFYGETDAAGAFLVDVRSMLRVEDYSATVHARPLGASFYYGVSRRKSDVEPLTLEAGTLRVLDFAGEAPELVVKNDLAGAAPPAQSVSAQGVSLEVPEGVQVEIEIDEVVAGVDGRKFRVRPLTAPEIEEVAPGLGLSALYAIGPFETRFSIPGPPKQPRDVSLSFPNSQAWPAGSAVEILGLGSYLFPDWVPPGQIQVVAEAQVSADGARVELAPGNGISYLSWFGLRLKP